MPIRTHYNPAACQTTLDDDEADLKLVIQHNAGGWISPAIRESQVKRLYERGGVEPLKTTYGYGNILTTL